MTSVRKPATATISGRDHSTIATDLAIKGSKEHFDLYEVPRRIVNDARKKGSDVKISQKLKYRKVNPYEKDRGEKIPYLEFSIESFSLFGLGVGQYFVQLLFYAALFACMGLILISTMDTYATGYYHPPGYDSLGQIWSVACEEPVEVTATDNCPDGAASCTAGYREDCPLHKSAVVTDLVFCLVFLLGVFILQYFEGEMEEDLDEAIQSPQDYSLVVTNPPADAISADEWCHFFSKFGSVKYITVTRKNKSLGDLLIRKYQFISDYYGGLAAMEDVDPEGIDDVNSLRYLERCIRKDLEDFNADGADAKHLDQSMMRAASAILKKESSLKTNNIEGVPIPGTWSYFWYQIQPSVLYHELMLQYNGGKPYFKYMLAKLDLEVCTAYRKFYPANQVFVTFNSETDKRNCLDKLEVADIKHLLPSIYGSEEMIRFRKEHVLNCVECPEADNIIYANTECSGLDRRKMQIAATCMSAAVLCGLYYCFEGFRNNNFLLTCVVGIVDVNLPFIYYYFASMEEPGDYDDLHDSVLTKLFLARFMISVVFTYFVNVQWADLLTPGLVNNLLIIQITVCLFAPVCTFADTYGVFERQFLSRVFSNTREEMNNWYRGSYWLLSERYSCFAKVITVSLFYAILTPFGVFIAAAALFLTYWLDRYLLLRKWRAGPMMDATMSSRFRQMVCFAVAAHMYVTLLLIYGWPHDSAVKVIDDENDPTQFHFMLADKSPPWSSYSLVNHPEWMQDTQLDTLPIYKWFTLAVVILTIYVWVGNRIVEGVRFLFWTVHENVGDAQDIYYEDVLVTMRAYCPVIPWCNRELIFADIGNMCHEQRSFYAANGDVGLVNLSELIPERKFANCMASVRYYSEEGGEHRRHPSRLFASASSFMDNKPSMFEQFIDAVAPSNAKVGPAPPVWAGSPSLNQSINNDSVQMGDQQAESTLFTPSVRAVDPTDAAAVVQAAGSGELGSGNLQSFHEDKSRADL